ncbi:hypothetical protein V8G54_003983 [Vigna mungo]|uniref:Uncharacterized protein n=1 Tax=Vigna mungo TaxID=3915 RepID=A0AAQ3PDY2_VIGMU
MTAEEDTEENGAAASDDDGSSCEGCDGSFAADEGLAWRSRERERRKGGVMGLESPKMASMVAGGVVAEGATVAGMEIWRDCVSNEMDGRTAAAPGAWFPITIGVAGGVSCGHEKVQRRLVLDASVFAREEGETSESPPASLAAMERCSGDWSWMHLCLQEEKMAKIAMYDAKIAA